MDFYSLRYIVYKETENRKLKVEWRIRAMKYEEKVSKLGREWFTRLCWEGKKGEEGNSEIRSDKERLLNSVGLSQVEVEI